MIKALIQNRFIKIIHFFREFLLSWAKARFTDDATAAIQKGAALVLESAGQAEDSIRLYIAAGDWDNAIRLICTQAPFLMTQGREGTISTWLSLLPPVLIDKTPWLLYWEGVLNLLINKKKSESCFEKAYNLFDVQGDAAGVYLSWCGIVNAIFHAFENYSKFDRWITLLDDIRTRYTTFPTEDIRARVTYTMFLALTYRNPMHPDFHAWAEDAIEIFQHDLDSCLRMEIAFHLACYCHMVGDFARASLIIGQLRESEGSLSEASPLSLLGWKATVAFYSWLTGSFEECFQAVEEGLKVSQDTGVHHLDYVLLGQGISGSLSSGNLTEAKRLLRKMASSLEKGSLNDRAFYHFVAAWGALLREDIPHALEHAKDQLKWITIEQCPSWKMFLAKFMMAQALHEKGEDQKENEYLSQAYQFAVQSKSPFFEYMCHISSSQFALDRGDEESCIEALSQAMAIGRVKGIVNFWGWRPDVMARLCTKALEEGIEAGYAQKLIRERKLNPPMPPFDKGGHGRIEIERWPWPLKIYTLGRFEVVREGTSIRFTGKGRRKPFEMLKVIIALGGRKIREERVSDNLWPEVDREPAYSAFTTLLSRLRSLVGREAILLQDGYLTLNPRVCWIDTWALERLLNQAEKTDQADPHHDKLMEKILSLYQGPFLEEDGMPWAYAVRERLASKFVRSLRRRGRYLEQKGLYEEAIAFHQRGLETDPLSEGLYRCLMACHHRLGRRAEALALYQRCRKTLSLLQGIDPSRETEALYQRIKCAG